MTKRFLEAEKHQVQVAENGLQSLNILKKDRTSIDVLLTDLQVVCVCTCICEQEGVCYVLCHVTVLDWR